MGRKYEIQSIPTKFLGIEFRSRLEARWALFFVRIGVQFLYEPCLLIRDGMRKVYVPDFWLFPLHCFFEVKPTPPTRKEIAKAQLLSISTSYPVYISRETFGNVRLFQDLTFKKVTEKPHRANHFFACCPRCRQADFLPREGQHRCGQSGVIVSEGQLRNAFNEASRHHFRKSRKTSDKGSTRPGSS